MLVFYVLLYTVQSLSVSWNVNKQNTLLLLITFLILNDEHVYCMNFISLFQSFHIMWMKVLQFHKKMFTVFFLNKLIIWVLQVHAFYYSSFSVNRILVLFICKNWIKKLHKYVIWDELIDVCYKIVVFKKC